MEDSLSCIFRTPMEYSNQVGKCLNEVISFLTLVIDDIMHMIS